MAAKDRPFTRFGALIVHGPGGVKRLDEGKCPACGGDIKLEDWKDEKSKDEFGITGLCQKCQDEVFAEPED